MSKKHKKPIKGELAIVWDIYKGIAKIELYLEHDVDSEWPHITNISYYKNAILFESTEQFKQFINS